MKTEKEIEIAVNNLMLRLENPYLDEASKNTAMGALAGLCWVLDRPNLIVPKRVRETLEDRSRFN